MNSNRDPFNLRRNSPAASHLLRNSALSIRQTASRAATLIESATNATTNKMSSYGLPNGGANDAEVWQNSGRSRFTQHTSTSHGESEGFGDKMSNMFSGGRRESLPMYKDKPYHYSPGKGGRGLMARVPPWARKRRVMIPALVVLSFVSWWAGLLAPLTWFSSADANAKKNRPASWFTASKEVVDWNDRADMVRDAFKISFAGYEKYGWGTCRVCAHLQVLPLMGERC